MRRLEAEWLTRPGVKAVIDAFAAEDLPIRFVGGAVRDTLLDRPVSDIDAATPVMPEVVMQLLAKHRIKAVPTGIAHGTVTAVSHDQTVEITTLRRDVETDGRHAVVAFTDDWKEDAARRDFTINALFLSPDGRLYDYWGGEEDLAQGRIRFIGDPEKRIEEDRLRVLRFFRFLASHGKPPADVTALGACEAASLSLVHLSGERIRGEMLKLLAAHDPYPALEMMLQAGVLSAVIGGPVELEWVRRLGSELEPPPPILLAAQGPYEPRYPLTMLRLAALLRSAGDPRAALAYVIRRWRMPNLEADLLRTLVGEPLDGPPPTLAQAHAAIHRHGQAEAYLLLRLRLIAQPQAARAIVPVMRDSYGWSAPRFPVSGHDLGILGIAPGPGMGKLLKKLEATWIESDFMLTREELLALSAS